MPELMRLVEQTGPAEEPAPLADLKTHLRVDITEDDSYITSLGVMARQVIEEYAGISMVLTTWDGYLDAFPGADLILPKWPLSSVTSITYTKDTDTADAYGNTVSDGDYYVDTRSQPGKVRLLSGSTWPSDTLQPANGVRVRFIAGFADVGSIPEPIIRALKMVVADMYEYRENIQSSDRARVAIERLGISDLLMMNHRSYNFGVSG